MKDTLKDQVIAITGTLKGVRKDYVEFIKAMGGEYVKKLSKRVTMLVEGETIGRTEKQFLAFMRDVNVVTEEDLFAMAGMTVWEFRGVKMPKR